jgi:sn-glycerol 3-phosphate transport system ATP-binding protein
MATLSFNQVKKIYGKGASSVPVIHGVTADISDGEFIVLVGPSGCGKSTLLRMVAGLEEISEGTISIAGKVVNDREPAERNIAMVFQNYALYPHMSVRENMAYGLKIRKLDKPEIERRVNKAATMLELMPLLDRKPRQLSGGQRQRVAMGRAIVREPQVFLFDEPLSNLDAKLRVQTRLEIQRLHRELGITSVYVTHDQVEAMTLAQRMMVMHAGKVEQFGTPHEVYHTPATTFVASFIGSPPMNLISGRAEGKSFVCDDGTRLELPTAAPREGALILGIRPEHVALSTSGWPMRVEMVEALGAEHLIHGKIGASAVILSEAGMEDKLQHGDTVHLQVQSNKLHWFDPVTQQRL